MKRFEKFTALCCCLALTASSLSGCAAAAEAAESNEVPEAAAIEESLGELEDISHVISHSDTAGKTETVYAILDADGHPEQTIVSTWLKNAKGSVSLSDVSELDDITVVKGSAEYEKDESSTKNRIVWSNDGSDIYYQGTSKKELPVDVSLSYELDGKPVSAGELRGASGHLKLTFHYTNHTAKQTTIHGEKHTIYQPFVMISGMLFDNSKAKNIEVDHGTAVNSGDDTIVFGAAMPGLKESLGLNDLTDDDGEAIDIDLPEEVCVEADVTDFSLLMTLTVASNSALSELGLDDIDSIDDLKTDIAELTDGMNEIIDGATELNDGSFDLQDGTNELSDGADDLQDGTGELKDGAHEVADGAEELNDGADALKKGVDTLKSKAPALTDGIGTMLTSIQALDTGLQTLAANNESLNNGIDAICSALGVPSESSATQLAAVISDSAALSGQLDDISADYDYSDGDYASLISDLSAYADKLDGSEDEEAAAYASAIRALLSGYQALYDELSDSQTAAASLAGSCAALSAEPQGSSSDLADTASTLRAGIQGYTGTVSAISGQVSTLNTGAQTLGTQLPALISGIDELSDGANKLAKGSKKLSDGASDLADGADELYDGTDDLKDGISKLLDGVNEFADGTLDLKDGVIKFNEEGIQKLADVVNEDLDKFYEYLKAVQDYAEEYTSYAGCEDDVECSVKFIYKTGSIE